MKFQLAIATTVILFSLLIKILSVSGYNFAFTHDQARDMLDLRQIFPGLSPKLVGPTTSINGVLLGPFWYYLNLPAYLFGGGNPAFIVYWQIILFTLVGISFFLYLYRRNHLLALIFSLFYFLMPISFETAKYFWNANAMPAFTALFLLTLIITRLNPSNKNLFLTGLVTGLSLQIEAALGVFFLPFSLLFLSANKVKLRRLIAVVTGFIVTLAPQIIFELIHGLQMSKIFFAEFVGDGSILGDKISFAGRLADRLANYRQVIGNSGLSISMSLILIIVSIVLTLRSTNKLLKTIAFSAIGLLIFCFFGFLLFPLPLKHWYLLGLAVPIVLIFSCFTYFFFKRNIFFRATAILFISVSVFNIVKANISHLNVIKKNPSLDQSNFANLLKTVDLVYEKANGKGFKVYSYLPGIYDYPYQYLFWWYGTKKYGYQPEDIAYLPNQPEYIRDQKKFWTKTRPAGEAGPVFLIIQSDKDRPRREEDWLSKFDRYCLVSEQKLPWSTRLIELKRCDHIAILELR